MTYKVSSGTLNLCSLVRLHRVHEMQTIVTDVCGVSLSVSHAVNLTARAVCAGSFDAAFAK